MAADVDKSTQGEDGSRDPGQIGIPRPGTRLGSLTNLMCVCLQEESVRILGTEGLFLFSSLDTDHDFYLSPEEFKPIVEKLTGTKRCYLPTFSSPLQLDSMTKSKDGFLGVSHSSLSGLRSWTSPAQPSSLFSASQFRAFLPPKNKVDVGATWWVIPSELNIFTGYLPNNRYHPPTPKGKEVLIHSLLSMFHLRPFIKSRFAPQGTVACIRASNDFYFDIYFRIHAEFQLNEVPNFPFWFTPGQFTGNIVLSKDGSHVRHFHLYVPNNRSLNVDMEWLYGASESSNMEVDIGFLPQMELMSTGPSTPSIIVDEEGNVIDRKESSHEPIQFVFEDIIWSSEISQEEALHQIEVTYYPFKKVDYLPFSDAFERAEAENKLVHSILLWGDCNNYIEIIPIPVTIVELSLNEGSGRTLRETVLESSPIMALLNQSFISSWSLVKELENLEKARLHLESYNFPVEMMVALPNGTIVHHINANYFLDQTAMKPEEEGATFSFTGSFEDPSTSTYLHFLRESLEKAKQYLIE
uniref:Selenoprotein N n=1 Tax=Neogobius melanostomus TaxID=47308 RepID=A0A8C6WF62_9GOBI